MMASLCLSSSIVLLLHYLKFIIIIIFSLLQSSQLRSAMADCNCFCSIITFGGSMADNGNLLYYLHYQSAVGYPPNGETFFGHPTGRFSDGRIISDFLAEWMGLPFLPAYLRGPDGHDFEKGVNFAFGGATALNTSFFIDHGLPLPVKNISLYDQIGWFRDMLHDHCSSHSDCGHMLSRTLFIIGPVGENDIHMPLLQGTTVHQIKTIIYPAIIQSVVSAIETLIELGARTIVVPNLHPGGCVPLILSAFQSSGQDYYDKRTGCIKWLNELTEFYNQLLQVELQQIQHLFHNITIFFADNYGFMNEILESPQSYGFGSQPLLACCGGNGPYNIESGLKCGDKGSKTFGDPSRFVFWDVVHPTEAVNKIFATRLFNALCGLPLTTSSWEE
ncbi:GDSL esterase/lipase At1g28580-like isoform X1 [Dioscorea cayenensis subsp. rotundata]|uniref:GDSL esterase/lipase At1g28580-like isoform X1 n=1 Tax=Dioscorea cayennensis subsp. rotundata TaxID=55577 RepID=A0AB40ANP0_DIOCR|nr:GDSL esterase/lipase At1g28580-like isoform X1 [Dioscorea cayenensis subsp. rotundata]